MKPLNNSADIKNKDTGVPLSSLSPLSSYIKLFIHFILFYCSFQATPKAVDAYTRRSRRWVRGSWHSWYLSHYYIQYVHKKRRKKNKETNIQDKKKLKSYLTVNPLMQHDTHSRPSSGHFTVPVFPSSNPISIPCMSTYYSFSSISLLSLLWFFFPFLLSFAHFWSLQRWRWRSSAHTTQAHQLS